MTTQPVPQTWRSGRVPTAAELNRYLRDSLAETMPAKATTAGQLFYAAGPRELAALAPTADAILVSNGTAPVYDVELTVDNLAAVERGLVIPVGRLYGPTKELVSSNSGMGRMLGEVWAHFILPDDYVGGNLDVYLWYSGDVASYLVAAGFTVAADAAALFFSAPSTPGYGQPLETGAVPNALNTMQRLLVGSIVDEVGDVGLNFSHYPTIGAYHSLHFSPFGGGRTGDLYVHAVEVRYQGKAT